MKDLVLDIASIEQSEEPAALASLIWSSGSIPMSSRAKMLVYHDGRVEGTIGGGCLEAEILMVARQVIADSRVRTTRYTMTEHEAGESGLNCGGSVRILTERVGAGYKYYSDVSKALRNRKSSILATVVRSDSGDLQRLLIQSDNCTRGSFENTALEDLVQRRAPSVMGSGSAEIMIDKNSGEEVFVEAFVVPPALYIFGGGHVGGQIVPLAKNVGFEVTVIDDRPMFANSQKHPNADYCVVGEFNEVFDRLHLSEQAYIVAATRGHQHDEIVIEQAIRTPAVYVGMLGSERKKMIMWQRITERGGKRSELDRVFAPIGFNIGADTPEEIAVSVVAELIRVRRGVRKEWKTKLVGGVDVQRSASPR